jgi:glutaredoxin-like protein NrdH
MNVHVYTKPGCVQCEYTEKKLNEWGVPHICIDVTQDAQAFNMVQSSGNLQMPMVVAGSQTWNGFKPDKLSTLRQIT